MKREFIFVYLELFTIRNLRNYSNAVIYHGRRFLISQLKSHLSFSDFIKSCLKSAIQLPHKEFSFVYCFLDYLNEADSFDSIF